MNSAGVSNVDTEDHFPRRNAESDVSLNKLGRNSPNELNIKKIHRI